MKKIALSVIAAFSLLAPAFIISRTASATTCPVKMPETLLSLYRASDAIYVGRYRGAEDGGVTRDDDEYTQIEIKKQYDISSVLKGKAVKTLTLIDVDLRYKGKNEGFETVEQVDAAQTVPETTIEDLEDLEEAVSRELKPGDDALLFLRNDEDSKRLELTDYRDGLKKLPREDIAVYEARIKELTSIFAAEKPSMEKITDWLVRCAEDEATRWEGTYELERSFDALEYKTRREAERKEKIAKGETVEDEEEYFNEGLETGRTTIFASLLNGYQKQTLTGILLNSEFAASPKRSGEAGFVRGDSELMSLVTRWADSRIAGVLINRLRSGAYAPRENSDLMDRIASMLTDDQMTAIAGKFSNIYYEEDERRVNDEDIADFEEMTAVEDETGTDEAEAPETTAAGDVPEGETAQQTPENTAGAEPAAEDPANKVDAETAEGSTLTYRQFRDMLIAKFLQRADEVMANPDTSIRAGK